jgi:hypothetical protein
LKYISKFSIKSTTFAKICVRGKITKKRLTLEVKSQGQFYLFTLYLTPLTSHNGTRVNYHFILKLRGQNHKVTKQEGKNAIELGNKGRNIIAPF